MMKKAIAAAALIGIVIAAARAEGNAEPPRRAPIAPAIAADWSGWTRPFAPAVAEATPAKAAAAPFEEIDVVDAHWMALTMWGEGRSQGEAGMRAIGHVIANRWQARRHGGYVTDTVSAAWQFSAWNEGDPNRAKMLNIDDLPRDGADYRLWLTAKRLAGEILMGRSADPTGGALFYHTTGVRPKWSEGVPPVARIGDHLFFRTAV